MRSVFLDERGSVLKSVSTLARYLLVVGALQSLVVGCSDDPVVGPRPDAAPDRVEPEDRKTPPDDQPMPEDRQTPPDMPTEDMPTEDMPTVDMPTEDMPTADKTPVDVPVTPDMPVTPDDAADAAVGEDAVTADMVVVEDTPIAPDVPDVMMGECTTSADCAMAMGGPVCDTTARRCVPCTATEDMCPVGNYCSMNRCVAGCRSERDCMGSMRCDTMTRMCVGCIADGDCALGTVCRAGTCVPGCSATRACGAGSTCCGTTCVNAQTDPMNCGACGTVCGMGTSCCAGRCVNPQSDTANCGMCGMACTAANAMSTCAMGSCGVGTCNAGFGNCDMMAANGCETNLNTTAAHCGRCGSVCPAVANATPTCAMGTCGFTCNPGFANCDGNAANGCEVNVATSATNCGRCGNACPAATNAAPACTAGTCGVTCNMGFGNCDGVAGNGCEANLNTSATACGACGRACTVANGTGACTMGTCGIGMCNTGFGNCDGNTANGCELDLRADRNNCGACGNRCSASAVCFAGMCRNLCTPPLAICGAMCVDTTSNNANCGACGRACGAVANGTNSCEMSICNITCSRGFGNCDAMAANGCERNLTTDVANCGRCGNVCTATNGVAACRNGACALASCSTGFADCDGNPANGCEVDVRAMTNNCGACGRVCSFANAASTCAAGTCALGTCNMGFGNCNGSAADGCETNLNTSTLSCGACGRVCTAGQACLNGSCVAACPVGTTFCSGACVNVQTNNSHCGACGRVCPAGQTCTTGVCRANVPVNDTLAGALPINLALPSTDFIATTTGATNHTAAPCVGGTSARGADVFYRIQLTRREFVFADSAGSAFDTMLYFADAAGTPYAMSQTAGDLVCNDDVGATCSGTAGGLNSRVFTVLNPGTHYLIVSGFGTSSGVARIHFEHLPASSGPIATLAAGMSTLTGVTSSTTAGVVASPTCGGAGPENSYWWVTCPGTGTTATPFTAETCGTAAFDTVIHLATGSGFTTCNDNACDVQSRISASYALSARLHALYIDGFTATSAGAYTLRVARP
jgi:Cys-rich repeat protein